MHFAGLSSVPGAIRAEPAWLAEYLCITLQEPDQLRQQCHGLLPLSRRPRVLDEERRKKERGREKYENSQSSRGTHSLCTMPSEGSARLPQPTTKEDIYLWGRLHPTASYSPESSIQWKLLYLTSSPSLTSLSLHPPSAYYICRGTRAWVPCCHYSCCLSLDANLRISSHPISSRLIPSHPSLILLRPLRAHRLNQAGLHAVVRHGENT